MHVNIVSLNYCLSKYPALGDYHFRTFGRYMLITYCLESRYTSIRFFFLVEFDNPVFFLISIIGNILLGKKRRKSKKKNESSSIYIYIYILVKHLDLILSKQIIKVIFLFFSFLVVSHSYRQNPCP